MKQIHSNPLSTALLITALVAPCANRDTLAQERPETSPTSLSGLTAPNGEERVALTRISSVVTKNIAEIEKLVIDVEKLGRGEPEKWKSHCDRIALLASEIENVLDVKTIDNPRVTFSSEANSDVSSLLRTLNLFTRVSNAYSKLHRISFPSHDGVDHRELSSVLSVLAEQFQDDILDEYKSGEFQKSLTEIFKEANVQRELYIYLAKNGPSGGIQGSSPYMQWAWAAQMDKDITSSAVFPKIADGSLFSTTPRPVGAFPIGIYGAGFQLVDVVTAMNEKVPVDEMLITELWRYATHPSGVNGHVSLSRHALGSLGTIAAQRPKLFERMLDTVDDEWGVSPRAMIEQNMRSPNEFRNFTDGKVGGQLEEFQKLGAALNIKGDK